jgi:CheY-like chemotaxis protein
VPHVLIIDDEGPIRRLLREVLEDAGYEVSEAETGVEGLESVARRTPDLVITDILMPDKEGLETILDLRRSTPDLPIIAISAGGARLSLDVLTVAQRFGARRAFRKPFDPFELLAAVQEVLEDTSRAKPPRA